MNLNYVRSKVRRLKRRLEALCKLQDDPTCLLSSQHIEEMQLTTEVELARMEKELSACLAEQAAVKASTPPRRRCVYCRATVLKGDSRCAKCKKQGRARVKGVQVKRWRDPVRRRIAVKRCRLKKRAAQLREEGREMDAILVELEREKLLEDVISKPQTPASSLPKIPTKMPTTKAEKRKLAKLKRSLEEEIEAWREVGEYARARELEMLLQRLPEPVKFSPLERVMMRRYHVKRYKLRAKANALRALGRHEEAERVEAEREALQPPVQRDAGNT